MHYYAHTSNKHVHCVLLLSKINCELWIVIKWKLFKMVCNFLTIRLARPINHEEVVEWNISWNIVEAVPSFVTFDQKNDDLLLKVDRHRPPIKKLLVWKQTQCICECIYKTGWVPPVSTHYDTSHKMTNDMAHDTWQQMGSSRDGEFRRWGFFSR